MTWTTQKMLRFSWIKRYFLISTLILCLIELTFLKYAPNLQTIHGTHTSNLILATSYLFASYIAQATLIMLTPALITVIIACLIRNKWPTLITAVLLNTAILVAQIVDTITFSLYRAHEITLSIQVMHAGAMHQVIPLSTKELSMLLFIIVIVLAAQVTIAKRIWQAVHQRPHKKTPAWISILLTACVLFSYGLMASVVSFSPPYFFTNDTNLLILKSSRLVPYYNDLFTAIMPINNPYQRTMTLQNTPLSYQTNQPNRPMHYPLHPLFCHASSALPNILFIVIDTWRFDAMTKKITPHVHHFSKKTQQFTDHWSGGNCTQSGIFSLFYGLPANYWKSTLGHQSPLLINILKKNHYNFLIDSSATLQFPQFDQNVFLHLRDTIIETPGDSTTERDQFVTKRFLHFLDHGYHHQHPFFAFIFYDAAHNYCDGGRKTHQTPFKPAIHQCARFSLTKNSDPTRYLNRYHNAVHFIDHEIGLILKGLGEHHLYKNTIIVITADHGEQFNDEKLGLWSHNSAYSPYQLHVPFMVYWPGKSPRKIRYFTSHNDLASTLLTRVLHCDNQASDYSVGSDLFKHHSLGQLIAGNYSNYANITPNRITRFYKNGTYAIRSRNSLPIPNAELNIAQTQSMHQTLNRYFKQSQ